MNTFAFPEGFLQSWHAGFVLGIQGHIVDSPGAAICGIGTVDGSHGQAHQEGICGGNYHFRNLGFYHRYRPRGRSSAIVLP